MAKPRSTGTPRIKKLIEEIVSKPAPAEKLAAPAPKPPGTRYTLVHPRAAAPLVIILWGRRIITGEVVQEFPSGGAAHDHFERVLSIRKKEGYVVTNEEEIDPEAADLASQPKDPVDVVSSVGKWTVTFKGKKDIEQPVCDRLTKRLLDDVPNRVQLICDMASPGAAWEYAILGKSVRSVGAFIFDTHFQTQTRQAANSIGDISASIKAFPNLVHLFATGELDMTPVSHPHLEDLFLLADPMSPTLLKNLGSSEFPNLNRLAISLASDDGPGPDKQAVEGVLALNAPSLTEVHLDSLENIAKALKGLCAKGLPPSWRTLVLGGAIEDEDELLAVLKSCAKHLKKLDVLAMPLADEVSSEADEKARELLANLTDSEEHGTIFLPATYEDW